MKHQCEKIDYYPGAHKQIVFCLTCYQSYEKLVIKLTKDETKNNIEFWQKIK